MTINKMQSLAIVLSLTSAHALISSEANKKDGEADKRDQLLTTERLGWKEGDSQAAPAAYVTSDLLQKHPIFQKIKDTFKIVEQKYDIKVETIVQLSLTEQREVLEVIQQDSANNEATELLSSMIHSQEKDAIANTSTSTSTTTTTTTTTATTEIIDEKAMDEFVKSVTAAKEAQVSADGTEATPAAEQLSWYLSYLKKFYGSSAAMEYALGQNQFDPANKAHKELLKEAQQEHVAANELLNSTYTQQFTTLKQKQCVTMAALLETVKTTLSGWDELLEQIQQNQESQKVALLQKHHEAFDMNEAKLKTIAIASPSTTTELEVSKELQKSVDAIGKIKRATEEAHGWVKASKQIVQDYAPRFAIEDKK